MWTSRLLILGLVRWLQPVHGYEVRRELLSWRADEWGDLKPGSIYHGLKKLSADGYLEVVATERVDNRPARTTYRVTTTGEQEFQSLLREKLWSLEHGSDPFFVAWSFVTVLGQREAAAMLRNRAARLRDEVDGVTKMLEHRSDDPRVETFLPAHIAAGMQLSRDYMTVTAQWCEDTADRVDAGELNIGRERNMTEETIRTWKDHIQNLDDNGRLPHESGRG